MTDVELSARQKLAVEMLDREVSISAGAGSGKTRVLVERFCRLVQAGLAEVDEVLTVTFTEKAAKEMKERMVERFAKMYEATGDRRFETARRRIETAYIGTIHAFAARALRENAFEAKVDPQFTVLTEVEAEVLKEKVLADLIAENQRNRSRHYVDLLAAYGKKEVLRAAKKLDGHLHSLGKKAADIECAENAGPVVDARKIAEEYFDLIEALFNEERRGNLKGALAEQIEAFMPAFPDLWKEMAAAAEMPGRDDPAAYTEAFDWNRYEELSLAEAFVDGRVGSKEIRSEYIKPAKEAAGRFRAALIAPIAEYSVQCLKTVLTDYDRAYTEAKREFGALDFDDLLAKTRALLIDPDGSPSAAADTYRSAFKFVMMDEFQDTNQLQLGIVKAVCRPGRLFTVGDAKQSIFSFIHSDVSVFQEHHRAVGLGGGVTFPLAENYRSRPEVIAFANWFFDKLWREDEDFDFEPLEAMGDFHPQPAPHVELLVAEAAGRGEDSRPVEARAIARRIKDLLAAGYKPGDILILFRSTIGIKVYEQALDEAGIDYYVVSGRGFYTTGEVRDVLNLLKVVDNPLNDIAVAAVLRSPMVSISDDALWWLTRDLSESKAANDYAAQPSRVKGKLYSGLGQLALMNNLNFADRDKLIAFIQTLERLHACRSERKITRLIELALADTEYDLKLLASPDGKRKYANIRKLMETAEAFDRKILFSLADFIRHIEQMAVIADREGEAPTETEASPVVRLMTVHKSKGLEAPVVFVADCSRKLNTGDSDNFIIDKDMGMACKVKNPLADKPIAPLAYKTVAERLKRKDIEESKRLLYVAATRAEELLIFSGSSKLDGKTAKKGNYSEVGSWLGWLERALEIQSVPDTAQSQIAAGNVIAGLSFVTEESPQEPATPLPTWVQMQEKELMAGALLPVVAGAEIPAALSYAEEMPVDKQAITLTVSQAVDFLVCPEKYRQKWVLGLEEPAAGGHKLEEKTGPTAAAVGSAVHDVLASVNFKKDIQAQIEDFIKLQSKSVQAKAEESCLKFLASVWPARLKKSGRLLQEVPFSVYLKGCRLIGRIDLLFEENTGWVVADYKTGSGAKNEAYALQVNVYALALNECLGIVPAEVALISLGKGDDFSAPVDSAGLIRIRESIEAAAEHIARGEFLSLPSAACSECGYRNSFCRVKKRPYDHAPSN